MSKLSAQTAEDVMFIFWSIISKNAKGFLVLFLKVCFLFSRNNSDKNGFQNKLFQNDKLFLTFLNRS